MTEPLLPRIDLTHQRALERGALQPIRTERQTVRDGNIEFLIRWVPALAQKDSERLDAALRRDPDFNPFLPPDPDLTVGLLGDEHVAVLNKYPVIARHLLIVTREFESQTVPLDLADFTALAQVMSELGGLGFYNGGTDAGASQRHKHMQWIPEAASAARLSRLTDGLPDDLPAGTATSRDDLPYRHCFVRLPVGPNSDYTRLGRAFHDAYLHACEVLGLPCDRDPMPPYNLLTSHDWFAVIPRSREHCDRISVNALGFAGSLFVPKPELIAVVRSAGPLHVLATVGIPKA